MSTKKATESSIPTIRIHDLETGEIIDRPMTAQEYADWQAQEAEWLDNNPPAE
jgi:hypothetical protein